jgi:uncharacterized protein YfaS (alpha-2-macroglobulin family)
MTRSLNAKGLVALGAILVLSLADVGAALATTDTASQNPDLQVSVSLSPEVAWVGDTVTLDLAVTNTTWDFQKVDVGLRLVIPGGQHFDASFSIYLAPKQALTPTIRYTVNEYFPKGLYSVTLSASNARGTSSATDTITFN